VQYKYGYCKDYKSFSIDDKNILAELRKNDVDVSLIGAEEVKRSLINPIGTKRLCDIVKQGEKIAIITSDVTRPMPGRIMLPEIISELHLANVNDSDITIIFALGSHRKQTEEEMRYLVGDEIFDSFRCIDSNPNDCIHLGFSRSGTPIDVFSEVVDADRRICLGNIEFHYFAGYSGGAKAIMPGVSSRAAIQSNHSAMVKEAAKAGFIISNPVREDIEEITDFIGIDFILNVILDEQKQIIKSVAGHHVFAHREGCKFLDKCYKVKIPQKADIVITTPGGYPKDINLYQAQKALDNAKYAVRDGGIIILIASCIEGLGEEVFEKWIMESTCPKKMICAIEENFELGGHKAAAIALVKEKAKIFIVSDLDDSVAEKIFMQPFKDIDSALKTAFEEQGSDATVILMPSGGSTLPSTE